jgi:hypothetical protein
MTGRAHPGVDAYLSRLPTWQRSVCEQLREIVWATDPDIEETVKRTVQPYFVLDGNVCALLATKDHVNLFLYDPTVADPTASSTRGTATRPVGRSKFMSTTRSTGMHSSAFSRRSLRTTGEAGGAGSADGRGWAERLVHTHPEGGEVTRGYDTSLSALGPTLPACGRARQPCGGD